MQNLLLDRNDFYQTARSIIGLFGVTENLTISKIVYRQNSVTLDYSVIREKLSY